MWPTFETIGTTWATWEVPACCYRTPAFDSETSRTASIAERFPTEERKQRINGEFRDGKTLFPFHSGEERKRALVNPLATVGT